MHASLSAKKLREIGCYVKMLLVKTKTHTELSIQGGA